MRFNSQLIWAFDYDLILVVDAPMRDYKKDLYGHLENISSERDQEIEFLKSSSIDFLEWDRVILLQWGAGIVV